MAGQESPASGLASSRMQQGRAASAAQPSDFNLRAQRHFGNGNDPFSGCQSAVQHAA